MLGNETYLVTGAGGFIGSHIVDRLRTISNESPNGQVHALGRSFGKLSELNAPGDFTFHQCDLQDNATLYPLLAIWLPSQMPLKAGSIREIVSPTILCRR